MPVVVRIPTVLRKFVDGASQVEAEGGEVLDALQDLARRYPELAPHLFDPHGKLRTFVNVFLNADNLRDLDVADRQLVTGDEISIVPAVAGGSPGGATRDTAHTARSVPGALSVEEMKRYGRHMIIPEVGVAGQQRLKAASVLVVGTGGLGSPLALYLAAAGIGRLGLVDFDTVDYTNLQRQIIHFTDDVGRSKLESAREKINALNPFVQVDLHETRLTAANALTVLADYDIVIDGTDNFPTRYLVNDACVLLGKPNVYGSIFRFEGQVSMFDATQGPCYRCLYPEPPPPGMVPSCAEGGVLGILPGIIGTLQANEAVKRILGLGESLVGRLVLFDALAMEFREVRLRKDPACALCGPQATIRELIDYEAFCGVNAVPPAPVVPEISVHDLQAQRADCFLLDVREPHEVDIARIAGSTVIPLGELHARLGEIDRAANVVVHCKSGVRSARAARLLLDAGYPRVRSLTGGILAWAEEIDPSIPTY